MHKVTKHVMPPEEARATTPCKADPERWFPDEQKPDPYAVAACWSCHFQRGCARRALAQPLPEFGIWGGYRLAPGPGLNRTRAQLAIVAGLAMGPPASPGKEVAAALEDLAAKPTDPVPAAGERTPARRAAARNPYSGSPAQQRFSPRLPTPDRRGRSMAISTATLAPPILRSEQSLNDTVAFGPAGHVFHGGIAVSSDDDAAKWSGWWVDCECGWSGPPCSSQAAAWSTHRAHLEDCDA